MTDITELILALIFVLGGVLSVFVIPFLRSKVSAETLNHVAIVIRTAVFAAEQIFGGGKGAEKKKYVLEYLAKQGLIADIDKVDDAINAQIEAVVQELTLQQKGDA